MSADDIAGSLAQRPLPRPDNVSAAYWEAAARGEVLYQECPACGHRQLYPRALCTACAAEPEWRPASGRGTVHTFTIIRQNWAEPFRDLVPYVVAIVELEEGPRMMANITDCPPVEVRIGMPVEAYTIMVEDGLGIPFWRPVGTGAP
ncbi:MAG TPA: Zn-ribbon domain-containing OB-fold protein [Acidimicrobiales bacterium]|jgi:uncharacterized OB-fold protein|nr:Zn-ribbon domain-containing OB-fold protein [Acidimicrobiales bacterium]